MIMSARLETPFLSVSLYFLFRGCFLEVMTSDFSRYGFSSNLLSRVNLTSFNTTDERAAGDGYDVIFLTSVTAFLSASSVTWTSRHPPSQICWLVKVMTS